MIGALIFLQSRSTVNRLHRRLVRLKQPKYLVGAIVGGCYFYFYFFRFLLHGGGGRRGPGPMPVDVAELARLLEFGGALVLMAFVVIAWVLPKDRTALVFSEAEVAFLFPAPATRRTLIHWKLARSQLAILWSTVLLSLVTNRFGHGGLAWIHAAGWWLILSTLNLHFLAASFAVTRLMDRGLTPWRRRFAVLVVIVGLVAVIKLWAQRTLSLPTAGDVESFRTVMAYVEGVFETGPALYLLFPFRMVVRPFLAPDGVAFFWALGPVLLLMALHYVWVVGASVAFEEASVELSRKVAEKVTAIRSGNYRPGALALRPRMAPFGLAPTGAPWIAVLWKNLIAIGQGSNRRFWIGLIVVVLVGLIVAKSYGEVGRIVSTCVGAVAGMVCLWTLMLGPQVVRQDLRSDLPNADLLKLLPVRGWEMVLGQVLGPAVTLMVTQWLLVLVAAVALSELPGGRELPVMWRVSAGLAAALVIPSLTLFATLVPNATVLLFPAWFQSGKDAPQGVEATGQRIIFALAQFLVLLIAVFPAALAGSIAYFLAYMATGPVASIPFAALASSAILAGEAAVGIWWLGLIFDRFDLTAE